MSQTGQASFDFTVLHGLLLTQALIIPPNADHLYLPNEPDLKLPLVKHLELIACLVSRKPLTSSSTYPVGFLDLVMKSWSEGTTKQYEPNLRRWFSFRSENWLRTFNADVTSGAEFLTQYFKVQHNTVRSAFSSIVPQVNGSTFSKKPLIKMLL